MTKFLLGLLGLGLILGSPFLALGCGYYMGQAMQNFALYIGCDSGLSLFLGVLLSMAVGLFVLAVGEPVGFCMVGAALKEI